MPRIMPSSCIIFEGLVQPARRLVPESGRRRFQSAVAKTIGRLTARHAEQDLTAHRPRD